MNDVQNQSSPTEEMILSAEESSFEENPASEAMGDDVAQESDEGNVIDGDLKELKEEFPELEDIESITELSNPIRYAALRDLGLSPGEAYVLTSRRRNVYDNRSHLTSGVPTAARSPRTRLSSRELQEMRGIFGDMSDSEIHKLYKKVTK